LRTTKFYKALQFATHGLLSAESEAMLKVKARALMVSDWYVNSDAAVKLKTIALAELKADPAIGWARGAATPHVRADQEL
jgi:hypothetical protein